MRSLLRLAIAILLTFLATIPAVGQTGNTPTGNGTVRDQLIGAWRLAWVEEPGADGKIARTEGTGLLVYARDGHMSVQIMEPMPGTPPPSNPVQYGQGGYEAYYGTFEVNEQAHTVTHHVEGALVRSLIGNDLTRVYHFSGKQLILVSSRPDEHWTIAWEHY